MGASRYFVGLVCAGLAIGCVENGEIDAEDLNLEYETAAAPDLPPPPPGTECVLIQRGTLGQVQDTDISLGNGPDWAAGGYPFTWTGPSPYNHVSLYRFDLSPVPPNSTVVLGVFSNYVSWNELHSTVRVHRIVKPFDEATSTWSNYTNNGAETGWDPAVLATIDPEGVGFHSVDVTGLVQGWYSGAVANEGLVLEEDPVLLHTYFASEASTVDMRPSLYVCYVAGANPEGGLDPQGPQCVDAGGGCGDSEDCCDGLTCIGGECGTPPPAQVCAEDGAVCSLNTPCCTPGAVCDGVCIPPAPQQQMPAEACAPTGEACGSDGACCTGSCLDGLCAELAAPGTCLQPDAIEACDPDSPCCAGSHCIDGLCFPDDALYGGTCSLAGEACDPEGLGQWCCWDQQCVNGTCQ